jgi:hypothetical protein
MKIIKIYMYINCHRKTLFGYLQSFVRENGTLKYYSTRVLTDSNRTKRYTLLVQLALSTI